MARGILLINLGTPSAPTAPAVRRYLREFLSDPYVVNLPAIARWLLVNAIIVPFRSAKSASAYREIWTDQGSPLYVYSQHLLEKLKKQLPKQYKVVLAMRYQAPSIKQEVEKLTGCDDIIVLPLFPQYALATSQTAIEAAKKEIARQFPQSKITIIRDFFRHPAFIQPLANKIRQGQASFHADQVLFSFHGLPVSQLKQVEPTISRACISGVPCPSIGEKNALCYRAQCYETARALASEASLNEAQWTVAFQSRLGKQSWTLPYTDQVVTKLREEGIKRLLVVCPAFVADCLETLEEINIRLRDQWVNQLQGEAFHLIPCLNADDKWVEGLLALLESY